CFASPSRYELTLKGKKVAGTAQKMVRDYILVHGAIPVESTYDLLFDVLEFSDEKSREQALSRGREKMTSIFEETGLKPGFDELVEKICRGFEKEWKLKLRTKNYDEKELKLIKDVENNRYLNTDWLFKK
ncbi:MAG: biotin/lipoate A/B protein ligase family protein, partial [Vulcanimicrobiota bacterium]